MASKETEMVEYNHNGVRMLLPSWLRIKAHAPLLEAVGKGSDVTLIIDPIHDRVRGSEQHFASFSSYIWHGPIKKPYQGSQFIERVGRVIRWTVFLFPPQMAVKITIFTPPPLEEAEPIWTKVLESITFDPSAKDSKPSKPGVMSVTTENNLFMVGPKGAAMPILDTEHKEDEQGFTALSDRTVVYIPGDSVECEVEAKQANKAPSLEGVVQAFCVPITVRDGQPLHLHEDTGGVSDESLKLKSGKYDLIVLLSPKKGEDEEGNWQARLYFLPEGTVGPKVLKLKGRKTVPEKVYIRPE